MSAEKWAEMIAMLDAIQAEETAAEAANAAARAAEIAERHRRNTETMLRLVKTEIRTPAANQVLVKGRSK